MRTNRQIYFELLNKHNKYLTEYVIKLLICEFSGFKDFTELSIKFDDDNTNFIQIYENAEKIENGIPYQYVMNKAYFMNEAYFVDNNVLIPRQETEQLIIEVDKKIGELQSFCPKTICDLCTGSGILAIEMKKRHPESIVIASDIDEKALKIAKYNAKCKGMHIVFEKGSIIEPLINKYKLDVLLCNPPYIENKDTIDPQVYEYEPHIALMSNPGTFFYEEIIKNLYKIMREKFIVGFEIGEDQVVKITLLLNKYLKKVNYAFKIDLYNKPRFLIIWKS